MFDLAAHLRRTWDVFKADDGIVEVRALDCSGKSAAWSGWATRTVSGYFDDGDAFVAAVTALDAERNASGVYVTLNPVQPDLLARARNRLIGVPRQGLTTEDSHIVVRRWLLLDFDPIRPAGISSTQAELKAALDTARHTQGQLGLRGWPEPVTTCSGNGIHLLYRVDLPNDDDARTMLKGVLQGLSTEFSTPLVSLDTTVFNASRIVKLYGTATRKGDATPERPHRRSQFLEATTSDVVAVPLDLLRDSIPAQAPSSMPSPTTTYAEVEDALRCLPAHFGANSYDTWRDVLMAVHSVLPGPDGVALCERYVPGTQGEVARKFASFDGSGVGVGTLFHIAKGYGYQRVSYSVMEDLPEISNDEIDALIRGELTDDLPFDIYAYRPEDGGILDAWDDHYGAEWLFIAGYDQWARWAETHWQMDKDAEFERSIEQLISLMNAAAQDKIDEALFLPEDERKAALNRAKAYSMATRRTAGRIASVQKMAANRRIARGAKLNTLNVLNFRNGTLGLNTMALRAPSKDDLLTYCLPFDFDPAATAPIWTDEYLARVFVHEETTDTDHALIALVQELFGYSLTDDTNLEVMVWLLGDGGNGKTVFIEILRALLGPLATSVDFQHLGMPGNYDLASLVGMRVAFSTESERGGTVAEGYVKRLVSGETIKARSIYGSPFEFKSTSKVWWAMNDKPVIKSTSSSMWRRLKLIPFHRKFEGDEKDPQLRNRLMSELPGILNWALVGLRRLWANGGKFTHSDAAEEFVREYERESNPVQQWIAERTIPAPEPMTSAGTLYANYNEWCKGNGRQAFNETNFGRELKRLRVGFKRNNGSKYALFIEKASEFITDMGL